MHTPEYITKIKEVFISMHNIEIKNKLINLYDAACIPISRIKTPGIYNLVSLIKLEKLKENYYFTGNFFVYANIQIEKINVLNRTVCINYKEEKAWIELQSYGRINWLFNRIGK